jgi:hypothetical protein
MAFTVLGGVAAGLLVAAAVTAMTDTRAASNLAGGVLLGLVGGLGSSILRGGSRRGRA